MENSLSVLVAFSALVAMLESVTLVRKIVIKQKNLPQDICEEIKEFSTMKLIESCQIEVY